MKTRAFKRIGISLMVLGICAGLMVAAGPVMAGKALVLGGSDTVGSLLDKSNELFVKLVKERAKGALDINFIRGSQLGNDVQVIEQMMDGSIQIYGDVLGWYANWVKDFSILNWGFTFDDPDHVQRFIDSPIFVEMAKKLREKNGIHILAAAPTQPRVLFAKRAVKTPADLKGLKMRVPDIRTYVLLWETLGTRPSRVAWAEIFLGLKTGVIEGAEGPADPAYAQKFHIAAPNVMLTNHVMSTMQISMNAKAFDAIDPNLQKVLTDSAKEAVTWARNEADKSNQAVLDKMKSEGAHIYQIDTAPFAKKAQAGVEAMEKDGVWSKGLWQKIRSLN